MIDHWMFKGQRDVQGATYLSLKKSKGNDDMAIDIKSFTPQ